MITIPDSRIVNVIRTKLLSRGETEATDYALRRVLTNCLAGERLIKIAKQARDLGLLNLTKNNS
jgi:hypothetical protein